MMNENRPNNKGFIRFVLLILGIIFLLSYFKIDLRNLASSDLTQGNVGFIWSFAQHIWYDYIKTPIIFLLHFILQIIQ